MWWTMSSSAWHNAIRIGIEGKNESEKGGHQNTILIDCGRTMRIEFPLEFFKFNRFYREIMWNGCSVRRYGLPIIVGFLRFDEFGADTHAWCACDGKIVSTRFITRAIHIEFEHVFSTLSWIHAWRRALPDIVRPLVTFSALIQSKNGKEFVSHSFAPLCIISIHRS